MPNEPETIIERDARLNISSDEIRDEIIVEVGMMASARTPEMIARYNAALARERVKNEFFTPDVLPGKAIDDEQLQYDLEEITRQLTVVITRLREHSVTPMLLGELEGARKHVERATKEARQLYDW